MSQVCAISIYVTNLKEGAEFYADVLGLKVKKELPYLVLMESSGADLVLCQAEDGATVDYPKGSAVVLGFPTNNLVETIGRLQAKGVDLIHSAPQDFPGGKFIAFRDPSRNVFELLEFNK